MEYFMDFSAILAIATIACGLIWLVDLLFFKRKRQGGPEPKLVDYARSFFPILLIVCLLRSFIVEPFRIPSGSMKPTLLEGDFILVNKFSYGLRLPIFATKITQGDKPARGDILVFRSPTNTSIDYIKRVIGLPGDKISYQDKVLYLNGQPVPQEFVGTNFETSAGTLSYPVKRFTEALPDKLHPIYISPKPGTDMAEITVPEGMYFVMGDNRDNSEDSRVWGFVPEKLILGKAFYVWLSWDQQSKDVRWNRIGQRMS